jgi:membrane protease YdiL (CAAX protease family)
MQEHQSIGAADEVRGFQPTWGPVMALVWAAATTVSTMVVAVAAGRLGLISAALPGDNADVEIGIALLLQIGCIAIVASRLRANPLDVLALRFPRRIVRSMLIGLALLIVSIVADFMVLTLQDFLALQSGNDENREVVARAIGRSGLLPSLALFGLIIPVQEEMMFRGLLLLSFFHTRLWFWSAAALTSALFAAAHNPGSLDVLVHAPYFISGLAFAAALRFTRSLWVPITMHALQNCIATLWWSL